MSAWTRSLLAAGLALLAGSCAQQGTQLLVEVTAARDLDPVAIVIAEVRDAEGVLLPPQRFALDRNGSSFAVVPRGGDASRVVEVTVTGCSLVEEPCEHVVARSSFRTAFLQGQRVTVRVELSGRCTGVMCGVGEVCRASGGGYECMATAILDAAVSIDAARDAAIMDADMDAPVEDAGASDGSGPVDATRALDVGSALDGSSPFDAGPRLDAAGDASVEGCPVPVPITAPGGRFTVPLIRPFLVGSCASSEGSEAHLGFTIATAQDVFIATHATSGTDTSVYLVRGGCKGGSEIACNDDADGLVTSRLQVRDLPAGTYLIVVDTEAATSSEVVVDVYITDPGSPAERCGDAVMIAPGTVTLTGMISGNANDYEPVRVGDCSFAGTGRGPDQVLAFHVPTSRTVTVSGCRTGNDFDQTLYLRTVCSDESPAAQVACNDDGCGGATACTARVRSSLSVPLAPGLYYLFVDGYMEAGRDAGGMSCGGNFSLMLTGI